MTAVYEKKVKEIEVIPGVFHKQAYVENVKIWCVFFFWRTIKL